MSFLGRGGGGGGGGVEGVGTVWAYIPGDSRGIIKYHSNQYVRCQKQWRTDELVDLLCRSGVYGKVFWWFVDLNKFVSN